MGCSNLMPHRHSLPVLDFPHSLSLCRPLGLGTPQLRTHEPGVLTRLVINPLSLTRCSICTYDTLSLI
jgi:hypothetical protein